MMTPSHLPPPSNSSRITALRNNLRFLPISDKGRLTLLEELYKFFDFLPCYEFVYKNNKLALEEIENKELWHDVYKMYKLVTWEFEGLQFTAADCFPQGMSDKVAEVELDLTVANQAMQKWIDSNFTIPMPDSLLYWLLNVCCLEIPQKLVETEVTYVRARNPSTGNTIVLEATMRK